MAYGGVFMNRIIFTKKKALLVLSILLCLSLGGCWKSDLHGNTYVEPEITLEYLITDFANQITRDGAEKRFGVIESVVDNKDDTYTLTVLGKQFVEDASQENGFYIADRNVSYELILSKNVRSVIFPTSDLDQGQFFLNSSGFIQAFNNDFSSFLEETPLDEDPKYFYFYIMHDSVELIIQQYIP